MNTYKEIVSSAGQILKSHELGRLPHVDRTWEGLEWRSHEAQEISATAELCRDQAAIRLYPSLLSCPYAGHSLLSEFGLLLLRQAGDKGRNLWRNKLALPEPSQIENFQGKLESAEIRASAHGYKDLIEGYKSACDRYVALNLANALQANNVPYADSIGVNVYKWGPTVEYANLRRYHSLVPLTSVYASREQNENFGSAFADLLVDDLGSVREKSVAEQMRKLIRRVVELAG